MSERGPLELIWTTAAPDRVRGQLGDLGLALRADGRFAAPPVAVTIAGDPDAAADSLVVGEPLDPEEDDGAMGPRLVGLGWATVDPERLAREFGRELVGDGLLVPPLGAVSFRLAAPEDRPGGIALVLLEPTTEGRMAAALARNGEGPVALYLEEVVAVPDEAFASAPTVFGRPGRVVRPAQPSGPFIVVLAAEAD